MDLNDFLILAKILFWFIQFGAHSHFGFDILVVVNLIHVIFNKKNSKN